MFVLGYVRELDSLPRECCLSETVALGIWKPPFEPWVQVNFDVGIYGHLHAASAGVVVIYLEGLLLGSVCFWSEYVLDVVVAEALACVHAIRFARDLGLRRVEFEGDSAVVISKLKSGVIDRSNISGYIWDARQLLLGFKHFKFQHIKRGGNRVAHLLAREGFLRNRDECWVEEGSLSIQVEVDQERKRGAVNC